MVTADAEARRVEALATALNAVFDYSKYVRRQFAIAMLAALPPGWVLVHEDDVARRLHEECVMRTTQHGWDAHVVTAERLLGLEP